MASRDRQLPARRTLVLALGDQGLAIASAMRRRLAERGQGNPALATVAIVADEQHTQARGRENSDGICLVSVDQEMAAGDGGQIDRNATRRAVLAAGQALVSALMEQLLGISRVQPAPSPWSAPLRPSPEVHITLVAALDDALAGACLLDVVYLARHLVTQRLNAAPQVTGLLLLPELEAMSDGASVTDRCRATLRELDQVMRPHDGFVTMWGDSRASDQALTVEGWGPPFDRGCYLLGALNAQSLALGSAQERREFTSEVLLHLAIAGLASLCDGGATPSWAMGERTHSYGAIGLALWVYPAERLIEYASRRMALELLEAWSTPGSEGWDGGSEGWAAVFWRSAGAAPDAMADQMLSAQTFDFDALWQPLTYQVTLLKARGLRQALDEQMARRMEALAALRPALDQAATDLGQRLGEQLGQAIDQRLDQPIPGRLPEAMDLAIAARKWLEQALASNQANGEQRWRSLEAIEQELREAAVQLDARIEAGCFPQPTWRSLATTLLRPGRLWQLAQAAPEVQRLAAAYAALQLRQTSMALEVLKYDLATMAYEAAQAAVERQIVRLAGINQAIAAAARRLAPIPPAPCGALGFGLELSALTPEKVEGLYWQARGALAELLADVAASPDRLSGWPSADAEGEDMAGVVLALARRRCTASLAGLSIDQLLVDALPDARNRLEALAGLVEAASPFLAWDETRLHSQENDVLYSCAVLGLGEGAASWALADTGEVLFAQVAPTGDNRRVIALCTVQGLPLEALAGWEGITAHADNGWPDGDA